LGPEQSSLRSRLPALKETRRFILGYRLGVLATREVVAKKMRIERAAKDRDTGGAIYSANWKEKIGGSPVSLRAKKEENQ